MLAHLIPDRFVTLLIATVALASILPAQGDALNGVTMLSNTAIFALFFFHGVKLPRQSVIDGLWQWHLLAVILAVGYVAFPLTGLALTILMPSVLSPPLWVGLLFLCALPTTVQSAIAYSAIAGGNVAVALIAAAASNIAGVIITPVIVAMLLSTSGASVGGEAIIKIALLLLVPFALGHMLQPRLAGFANRNSTWISRMDKLTIILAVFAAFSAAVADGLWSRLDVGEFAMLTLIIAALLALAMAGAWQLGRALGLARADRITLMFSGSHKTLATGAPMAQLLFPAAAAGTIIIPLMIYHQLQLIVSAAIAARLARTT